VEQKSLFQMFPNGAAVLAIEIIAAVVAAVLFIAHL